MPFKMVTDRQKQTTEIADAAGGHALKVARSVTERFRSKLPAEQEVIDLLQLQTLLAEELREMREEFVSNDERLVRELRESRELRQRRDQATAKLRDALYRLRDLFEGLYGEGSGLWLFEEQPTVPTDPVVLHRLAARIHRNLTDPTFELPPPRQSGVAVTVEELAAGIEEPFQALGEAVTELGKARRRSDQSFEEKAGAMRRFDSRLGRSARFLEALYDFAEHDVLADRTRRSSHRTQSDDPEPEGDELPSTAGTEPPSEPGSGDEPLPVV